jgi:RimJ/RimL family protein N-acetyltransferase
MPTDLPAFQALQGNVNVMQYTTGIPQTPAESAQDLAEIIARYRVERNETWIWAAITPNNDFAGTCALFKNEAQEFEIAYRLLEATWGQGYGQEIADGLIAYCLDSLKLNHLVAQTARDNFASVKILERSRLLFEGEARNKETGWIERVYRHAAAPDSTLRALQGVEFDDKKTRSLFKPNR